MAAVRIRDNGCGIADDKLGKIFNPFYTSKETGTGLGLGVAKKVIDSHRGTIQVHSTVGVATEFIIEIPLSDAVRDAIDAVAALNGEAAESADSSGDARATQNLNGQVDIDAPIVNAGATSSETSRARN
jgi:nitrogen fixation/metabolism regulation signal transduction histidine kinase